MEYESIIDYLSKIKKVKITLGQFDPEESTQNTSKYWVPKIKKNELVDSEALFVDREIMPNPYEKIIHIKETSPGLVKILVLDAKEFPGYEKWFDLSNLNEPEDPFSKLKDFSLFKPIKS